MTDMTKGNGEPFNPWGGITIHGVYYFLAAGSDLHTLYRHVQGESVSDSIGTYGRNFNPMDILIDILTDRRALAERAKDSIRWLELMRNPQR